MMVTKRPKPIPTEQLEDLLKAHALRRLEGCSSTPAPITPKRAKTKPARTKS
jgi:hypothetical protein